MINLALFRLHRAVNRARADWLAARMNRRARRRTIMTVYGVETEIGEPAICRPAGGAIA